METTLSDDSETSSPKAGSTKQSKDITKSPASRSSSESFNASPGKRKEGHTGGKGTKDGEGYYDPHEYRAVRKPLTYKDAIIHLVKSAIGTGIFAMPQAFISFGLITGFIATIVIAVILTHAMHLIIRAEYLVCQRVRVPLLSYPETVVKVFETGQEKWRKFSGVAGKVIDFYLCLYQLGICCCYIVFVGLSLAKLLNSVVTMSVAMWETIVVIPIIGMICIRDLKTLAPVSGIANALMLMALAILTYFIVTSRVTDEDLDLWGSYKTFPFGFGVTLFALTVVGTVLCIENDMKKPVQMIQPFGVLNVGMCMVVAIYLTIGMMGYNYCVSTCADSITLNLPANVASSVSNVLVAIAILLSYPLQAYPPIDIIWNTYVKPKLVKHGKTKLMPYEYATRIFLVLLTFALGATIPQLGNFIGLFGAFCLSCLGCMFPAILELMTCEGYGKYNYIIFKDLILIVVGFAGMIAGSYVSLVKIIQNL